MRKGPWTAGLALLLALTLCACAGSAPDARVVLRATPESSAPSVLQADSVPTPAPDAQYASLTVDETVGVQTPDSTAAQSEEPNPSQESAAVQTVSANAEDDGHFLTARQSEKVQALFWAVYRGVEAFEERIALPVSATREQVEAVGELLTVDSPELFYFSHLSAVYYPEGQPDCITEVGVSYSMDRAQAGQAQKALDSAVQPLLEQAKGLSDYEKERLAHDSLIEACTYDTSSPNSGTVYGALVEGRARCQGYANAMTYLLRRMGLPCAYLYGTAENASGSESHAWNLVCVGGVWTLVDATWDDPTGGEETLCYAYFNLNSALMGESHVLDAAFERYALPKCTSLSVSYSAQEGALIYGNGFDEAAALLAAALAQGSPSLSMQFVEKRDFEAAAGDVQSLLQRAAEMSGVFPGNVAYVADAGAHWLEFRAIDYGG